MEKENSAFNELWNSIKYAIESKKGKFNLDTYLDIVGEYADGLIKKSEENEQLTYQGGYCEVSPLEKHYRFKVKMYFKSTDGKDVLKKASREIKKSKFTSETAQALTSNNKYEIFKSRS